STSCATSGSCTCRPATTWCITSRRRRARAICCTSSRSTTEYPVMKARPSILFGLLVSAAALAPAHDAAAQNWPSRPVRMIVPYPAGGGTDIIARTVAHKLTEKWGQQVIVDNRPGANGIIGTSAAAKAKPDGQTFVVV